MGLEECRGNQQAEIVTMRQMSQRRALSLRRLLAVRNKMCKGPEVGMCGNIELSNLSKAITILL